MKNIQSIIDRLENCDANLQNPLMPATISVDALKEIIPEVINDLKTLNIDIFISVNNEVYNKKQIIDAWDNWLKDYVENPDEFEEIGTEQATGENSLKGLIYYLELNQWNKNK
ncbi:hypothetical protein [Empedobacter tilapiae]|uniref:hypothetical protein n=1 Tax=Empedobacter tilapiae TaxID=2491114 RepID=UPI0028D39041|nr:hypothetical protein [Empedobacter tilapiae]